MYVIKCPTCAHPAPVSLASPDATTCPACGYSGALPAEISGRLKNAAQWLRSVDVHQRQLSDRQRKAVFAGASLSCGFYALVGLLLMPGVIWALIVLAIIARADSAGWAGLLAFVGFTPFLILVVVSVVGARVIKKGRHRLALASAAAPGDPDRGIAGRCRVCGADLVSSGDPVVRCAFCEADNVVERNVVEGAARAQHDVLEDVEAFVGKASQETATAAKRSTVAALIAFVGGPLATTVGFVIIVAIGVVLPIGPAMQIDYALVDGPSGTCVAEIQEWSSGHYLEFCDPPPAGETAETRQIQSLDGLRIVKAPWLVGRRVVATGYGETATGTVTKVHSTFMQRNNQAVVNGSDYWLQCLCLAADGNTPEPVGATSQ